MTAEFTSRQAGYGDRTGMMMAEMLTTHQCVITIDESNKVLSGAVMDGQWNMINQKMISAQALMHSSTAIPNNLHRIFF